jgi:hypothetical protein
VGRMEIGAAVNIEKAPFPLHRRAIPSPWSTPRDGSGKDALPALPGS